MNVLMVRAKIREENLGDARAAVGKLIEEFGQERPAGVQYASCLLSDRVTFVALLKLEDDGATPCASSLPTRRWWRTSGSDTRSRRRSSG